MRLPGPLKRLNPSPAWRAVRRLAGRLSGWLPNGLAPGLLIVLAMLVLAGSLYSVAQSETEESRGFAEFTMFRRGCALEPARMRNVLNCQYIAPGAYRVVFSRDLDDSTPLVSRALCCPGRITASVESENSVLIGVPRVRNPVRATLFMP